MNTKTAKNNRRKGHQFERDVVTQLREIGIPCETSRYSNKKLDDAKVDIDIEDSTPLNIQCKCHNTFKNPISILEEMPEDSNYNIELQKVKRKGVYAIMKAEDFFEIIQMLKVNKIL